MVDESLKEIDCRVGIAVEQQTQESQVPRYTVRMARSKLSSFCKYFFSIIALGTSAGTKAKGDEETSVRFFIATSIFLFVLGIALLIRASASPIRTASIGGLAMSAYCFIFWVVAWVAIAVPRVFRTKEECLKQSNTLIRYDLCAIYRLRLAAWILTLSCLLLWVGTLVVASLAQIRHFWQFSYSWGRCKVSANVFGHQRATRVWHETTRDSA